MIFLWSLRGGRGEALEGGGDSAELKARKINIMKICADVFCSIDCYEASHSSPRKFGAFCVSRKHLDNSGMVQTFVETPLRLIPEALILNN